MVPLSQGQVIVSIPSGTVVSASVTTSTVSPSSTSTSAAAGLQRLAAQCQQVTFTRSVVKIKCQHCNRSFATKPELLDYKVIKIRAFKALFSQQKPKQLWFICIGLSVLLFACKDLLWMVLKRIWFNQYQINTDTSSMVLKTEKKRAPKKNLPV